jgi:cytidyltransferase-like protein
MIRVLALGCFDCLHPGHIAHLRAASALGDHLTVAVAQDANVNKGPGHPLFPFAERVAMIKHLNFVDEVLGFTHYNDVIPLVRPEIYVKGIEYHGALPEKALVESLGGVVKFLNTLLRERIDAFVQSC